MPDYAALVEGIVKGLVDLPDQVRVSEVRNGSGSVLVTIKVADQDMGRVIGRRGSTINAIRLIAKAAAVKAKERVDVEVDEEEGPVDGEEL
ncbi:MAG: KH domain-containing protein [Thermanaerothrix sp.]|nr:KH domain-containing protein [Thermanaerothrix sp.]